ncbi:MAG: hypothetical protein WDZ80_03080 [Candidatus Paceibacterota bacterium]
MNNREVIKKLIVKIEQNYDVNSWVHNGYKIWPVLRIALYMILVNRLIKHQKQYKKTKQNYLKSLLLCFLHTKDILQYRKNTKYLYVGATTYCVNYKGYMYNRYFDPLMDANTFSSIYLSKSDSKNGVYKPERHLLTKSIFKVFSGFNKFFKSQSKSHNYVDKLCDILKNENVRVDEIKEKLKKSVIDVDSSYFIYLILFKRLNPEQIWVLWYYSYEVLGMLIAADKLSIPTIDLQHGGQGENHLAYNSWTKVPKEGYEALPNYFYTWDASSANHINTWALKNKKHSAVVFGNPWVEGWKKNKFVESDYEWPENIILYTLQPLNDPIEDFLIDTVKKSDDNWNWWFRLHPRQIDDENLISDRLKRCNLLDRVNIQDATYLHLPEILLHTEVHITQFSGSAGEAYQFGIPTILINKIGVDYYKEYIKSNDLMYSSTEKDSNRLYSMLKELITKN